MSLLLVSQFFTSVSNRQASIVDCVMVVKEVYISWRGGPSVTWILQDLREWAGPHPIFAHFACLTVYLVLPAMLWWQNYRT